MNISFEAYELLAACAAHDIDLSVDSERLICDHQHGIPADIAKRLRQLKPELLQILRRQKHPLVKDPRDFDEADLAGIEGLHEDLAAINRQRQIIPGRKTTGEECAQTSSCVQEQRWHED